MSLHLTGSTPLLPGVDGGGAEPGAARELVKLGAYDYLDGHTCEDEMTTYSVADAKSGLPRLIDRAIEGEEVVISRHGRPIAELRPIQPRVREGSASTYDWLKRRRAERPSVGVTAVELLDELYESDRD